MKNKIKIGTEDEEIQGSWKMLSFKTIVKPDDKKDYKKMETSKLYKSYSKLKDQCKYDCHEENLFLIFFCSRKSNNSWGNTKLLCLMWEHKASCLTIGWGSIRCRLRRNYWKFEQAWWWNAKPSRSSKRDLKNYYKPQNYKKMRRLKYYSGRLLINKVH